MDEITLLPLPEWTHNERHFNQQDREDIQAYARECVEADRKAQRAALEQTDAEIEAAYAALQERKKQKREAFFQSKLGTPCSQCKTGVYESDSNGYHNYHRCYSCRHVPMWLDDGTETTLRALIDKEATPTLALRGRAANGGET